MAASAARVDIGEAPCGA